MKAVLKKGLFNLLGYANYHRALDIKNAVLHNSEQRHRKEALSRMIKFYSQFIQKGDLCFDIGANMGNRVAAFLKIGARIVAVEPQEKCCAYLKKKYGNNIMLVSKGCGEKEEIKDFYISDSSTISSFSKEWIDKVKEGRFKEHNWNQKVQVHLTTLDRLIEQYGTPQFIKIDVEGFEPEVLKGLSKPISMISFEYSEPEQHQNTVACLQELYTINKDVQFNYSIGELMQWAHNDWLTLSQKLEFIETPEFIKSGFGDIYAKNKQT